jgi:hypothetical protein
MNAMLPHGGKVHAMRDAAPRCGGGRHGKRGPWQLDMGDVTCRRCVKFLRSDGHKAAKEKLTADEHR